MTQPTIEQMIDALDNYHIDDRGQRVINLTGAMADEISEALAEKQGVGVTDINVAQLPEMTSSKSDAQIADELQQSMDALLEPDDEGDKIKYRTLIRIMARARNRLRQIDAALAAQREGK